MSLGKGFLGDSKLIIPPAMPLMNYRSIRKECCHPRGLQTSLKFSVQQKHNDLKIFASNDGNYFIIEMYLKITFDVKNNSIQVSVIFFTTLVFQCQPSQSWPIPVNLNTPCHT